MSDSIETVSVVSKDSPTGFKIINKADMTSDDKEYKGKPAPAQKPEPKKSGKAD